MFELDSVNSISGATVMLAVVLILTWACSIGITTTASRMTWSFARDKGTPFHHAISFVSRTRRIPIVAVAVVATFAALLTLIYIGSTTAFNDVISLTITGFYCSYFLPASFLLYHRIKRHISPYERDTLGLPVPDSEDNGLDGSNPAAIKKAHAGGADGNSFPTKEFIADIDRPQNNLPSFAPHRDSLAEAPLQWGPFHLPGLFGTLNNAYACVYMIFVIFWSVWPPVTPVDASTMNYSVVVTGGVVIFSIVWYFVRGRKEYTGPTIDDEVRAVMRLGSVGGV